MWRKYLKAYLQENDQDIPKVHKLLDPSLEILISDLKELERFSVNIRYPGVNAEKDEARTSLKAAEAVRSFFRQRLMIPEKNKECAAKWNEMFGTKEEAVEEVKVKKPRGNGEGDNY